MLYWFQHALLYTSLTFACKTETLSSLYSHALLILTKSSKSKHQVVHEQKFKDLLSSTCQVSVERSMLDLRSEVQWFNTHWGNILLLEFFCFHIVKPLMPILALLPISFNYEKPRLTLKSQALLGWRHDFHGYWKRHSWTLQDVHEPEFFIRMTDNSI